MSDELPEGWAAALLGQLTSKLVDGSHNPPPKAMAGRPMLSARNIEGGRILFDDFRWIADEAFEVEDRRTRVQAGDVLLTIVGTIGRVAVVAEGTRPFTLQRSVAVLTPTRGLDSNFLAYQMCSPAVQTALLDASSGTAQKGVYLRTLSALSLKVAPLAEQRRIVAKVEALLARVNAAQERLEKVPLLLKRFRQAVLAKAFRGELVPTEAELAAREGRPYQSAAELLGRPQPDDADDVPEGWLAVTVEELLPPGGIFDGPFGSSLKSSDYTDAGVRVIRLENVANLRFVADKDTWISKAKYQDLKRHTVGEGDIIFGSFVDETCRVCLLPKFDTPAIAKADCFCLRPHEALVDRKFLVYQLGSSATRNALLEEIHGATRPRINTRQLRALRLLLPPLSEQRRVAAKIEALLAKAARVEAEVERLERRLDQAPQAILQRAFTGGLVPLEAELAAAEGRAFEGAADLLEQVRETGGSAGNTAPGDKITRRKKSARAATVQGTG